MCCCCLGKKFMPMLFCKMLLFIFFTCIMTNTLQALSVCVWLCWCLHNPPMFTWTTGSLPAESLPSVREHVKGSRELCFFWTKHNLQILVQNAGSHSCFRWFLLLLFSVYVSFFACVCACRGPWLQSHLKGFCGAESSQGLAPEKSRPGAKPST